MIAAVTLKEEILCRSAGALRGRGTGHSPASFELG